MSLLRTARHIPLLTASLSVLLAACAMSGSEQAVGPSLNDPAMAARPSTAGVADSSQATKPAAARPDATKQVARADPAKTAAVKTEPAKTAAKAEPAKTAAKTDTAPCSAGGSCMNQLKRMVDGTNRTWIGRPEPPQQFADGTRLFAYRALRPNLTCRELSLALAEIDTSSKKVLDPASAVSSERAQRVAALATDVAGELSTEQAARCSAAGGTRTTAAGSEPTNSQ
jgi:hypothetical protein